MRTMMVNALGIMITLVSLSSTGYSAEGINETFENFSIGPIDGQGNWTSGPTGGWDSISEVVSSPTHTGSRSLHLSGFVSNATYTVENPAPPNSTVTVSFWYLEQFGFVTNDTGNNMSLRNAITLSDGYNLHITYANVCHAGTGHRSVLMTADAIGNGSCINGVGDMTEGNWYFIEIEYDFENRTAHARIDGGDWGNPIDLRVYGGAAGSYIVSFEAMSLWDNPPQFWFDDFSTAASGGAPPENESDHFTWPVGPEDTSTGHYGWCRDWRKDAAGCYWLSDYSNDQATVWRDVQPFQLHYYAHQKIRGYHLGADYNIGSADADNGQFVYPAAKGEVSEVLENACGWGNIIFVRHDASFGAYTSMYAHVDWINGTKPTKGTAVDSSTPIATVGNGAWNCGKNNKGRYTPHLHFELREGESTLPGPAYMESQVSKGPQGQIDPNEFISSHR